VVGWIFRLLRNHISPSLYASLLRVTRTAGEERFIMIFLMFTLATGIFNAETARTINRNMEDKIHYETGADIRVKEVWVDNSTVDADGNRTEATLFYEPDFMRFTSLPEVESAARVLLERTDVSFSGGKADNVQLMGIVTDEFGKTAWARSDLYPAHINLYLNTLSRDPRGVLLSSNFKEHFKIGDVLSFRLRKAYISVVVYGFVDYWPGFRRFDRVKNSEGVYTEKPNWLIVSNLNYVQAAIGLTPYEIWMKTNSDSNNFLTRYANDHDVRFAVHTDFKAAVTENRNDPVLQGTNGALTVDFIITLLVCATGFLIYWILSIKSRILQFGVFRAMGLSMRGILGILVHEQVLISGVAIALGAGIGELASRLFVPIIQIAYSASEQSIPLLIVADAADYGRLFFVVGLMIVICLAILGVLASRIKIAQALKLGED
jgi:putative ABC transport system permease protein